MRMLKMQRNQTSSASLVLGLAVPGLMAAGLACSSGGGDEDGSTIPNFVGGVPGGPAAPGAQQPGAAMAPGASSPDQGAPPSGADAPPVAGGAPEGQNDGTPLAPGAAAGTEGTPVAGGGEQPADPGAPVDPAAPAEPGGPVDGARPPNFFTSGEWQGLVTIATRGPGTTVTPATFDTHVEGAPFCVSGTVAQEPAFENGASVVFNLDQDATVNGQTQPAAVAPLNNGIAVTFSRSTGAPLRMVLTGPNEAWCTELVVVQGQAFVPYNQFSSTCWDSTAPGEIYARQPVTSLAFEVPGRAVQATEYGFCVAGFSDASGVGQAPPVPPDFIEAQLTGTLSEKQGRAIVTGNDGKKYVVSNNAWAESVPHGAQIIDYANNSFTILQQNAGGGGSQVLTFPYVSVGRNGAQGGNFSQTTTLDDNLPIQISQLQSVRTRFAHNVGAGGVQGSDFNATYDVWFAAQPPIGNYGTASGAFLMVWTHIPNGRTPIGQVVASNVALEGRTFTLWVGRRDEGLAATGQDGASPVISYVANGTVNDYEFDLNAFIRDAVQRASTGNLRGLQFSSNLYLTDVFAGFEIWNGGQGLRLIDFTVDVQGG
jgi:hypothetical protein